jgi:hypothetical protein
MIFFKIDGEIFVFSNSTFAQKLMTFSGLNLVATDLIGWRNDG